MFSIPVCYILPLDVLCFVVTAKRQILFPVSLSVIQVLIRYSFSIPTGLPPFSRKNGQLVSIDVESLTAEKCVSGRYLQAEPCYIQVKIKGKAEGSHLPNTDAMFMLFIAVSMQPQEGIVQIWHLQQSKLDHFNSF